MRAPELATEGVKPMSDERTETGDADDTLDDDTVAAARRREIEHLVSGSLSELADKSVRRELWR